MLGGITVAAVVRPGAAGSARVGYEKELVNIEVNNVCQSPRSPLHDHSHSRGLVCHTEASSFVRKPPACTAARFCGQAAHSLHCIEFLLLV